MHKYSYKVTKRPEVNAKGESQIRFSCRVNNQACKLGTQLYILPLLFNQDKSLATQGPGMNRSKVSEFNKKLKRERDKLESIFARAEQFDEPLTPRRLREYFQGTSHKGDFIEFAREHILQRKNLLGNTPQTTRTYYNALDHAVNCMGTTIPFYALEGFAQKFENHLKKEGLSINTRRKNHTKIKTLFIAASKVGLLYQNPYNEFKIGTIKGERQVLTLSELHKLLEIYLAEDLPNHLQNTLNYFLFSCFTGLRYSDLLEITHHNLVGDKLKFTPVKGKRFEKTLTIPIPKIARPLIKQSMGKLFNVVSDQKSNKNLKSITTYAAIEKHITMHSARHTFGTMFIVLGGNVAILKELMGHSKIETTNDYLHLAEQIGKEHTSIIDEAFSSNLKVMTGASYSYQ